MGHKYHKCFWKVANVYGASKLVEFKIKAQITIEYHWNHILPVLLNSSIMEHNNKCPEIMFLLHLFCSFLLLAFTELDPLVWNIRRGEHGMCTEMVKLILRKEQSPTGQYYDLTIFQHASTLQLLSQQSNQTI